MGKRMNTSFNDKHMSEDEALERAAKRSKIYYVLFVIILLIGLASFFYLKVWNNEEKESLPSAKELESYIEVTDVTAIIEIVGDVKTFKQDNLKTYYFNGTIVKSYKGPYAVGDQVEIYKTTESELGGYSKGDKFVASFVFNESESLVIPEEAYDHSYSEEVENFYNEIMNNSK